MAFRSNFEDPGTDPVYQHPAGGATGTTVPGMNPSTTPPALIQPTKSESSQEPGGLIGVASKMGGGSQAAAGSGDASLGGSPSTSDSSL